MSFLETLDHVREQACDAADLRAIRASRAWVQWDGTCWLAMRIGKQAITGAGSTVEEAIEALRAQEVQDVVE